MTRPPRFVVKWFYAAASWFFDALRRIGWWPRRDSEADGDARR